MQSWHSGYGDKPAALSPGGGVTRPLAAFATMSKNHFLPWERSSSVVCCSILAYPLRQHCHQCQLGSCLQTSGQLGHLRRHTTTKTHSSRSYPCTHGATITTLPGHAPAQTRRVLPRAGWQSPKSWSARWLVGAVANIGAAGAIPFDDAPIQSCNFPISYLVLAPDFFLYHPSRSRNGNGNPRACAQKLNAPLTLSLHAPASNGDYPY